MNYLRANMKLIVECSQKLVRLGENLWGKDQKLDKEMQEHQKLCDEIMAIQGIEPIEAEIEEVWHCPEGYQFVDENGNVINATKIVLEKKKKEYPKTYEECCEILKGQADVTYGYKKDVLHSFQKLLICRDAYWKIAGEKMGLGKPWEPDWEDVKSRKYAIVVGERGKIVKGDTTSYACTFAFPTEEMRDAFYENFKELIESCKELCNMEKITILANRLAESILMDWDKEEQVKLAKEVACECHKYFNEK